MDEQDLNRLRRRFGENIDDWPAPHGREARDFRAGRTDPLHAALMTPTDETALAAAVLTRLAAPRRSRPAMAASPRLLLAGYATVLIAALFTGYGLMPFPPVDPILALALGDGMPALMSLQ
jgi:hypothetical protein